MPANHESNLRKFIAGEPQDEFIGQPSPPLPKETHAFNDLASMLGAWVVGELRAARDDPEGPDGRDIGEVLGMLAHTLPRFGHPGGPWMLTVEPGENDPSPEFVMSNVCADYYVNGKYVQFMCAQGRCTVNPD